MTIFDNPTFILTIEMYIAIPLHGPVARPALLDDIANQKNDAFWIKTIAVALSGYMREGRNEHDEGEISVRKFHRQQHWLLKTVGNIKFLAGQTAQQANNIIV